MSRAWLSFGVQRCVCRLYVAARRKRWLVKCLPCDESLAGCVLAGKRARGLPPKLPPAHQHEFDSTKEVHNEDTDMWSNACTLCGHTVEYEKM